MSESAYKDAQSQNNISRNAQQYSDLDLDNSLIQISPASVGALEPIWSPSVFKAQRHWAYAAQWYGLFVVLLIGYIIYGNKRGREANEE